MARLPREFDLIARHFRPLAGPGALALADDAAVIAPPPGQELILTADAMVAGVHFLPDDPPNLIARKLLRVNLSDLAAKGASPVGYLLTLSAPRDTPDQWFGAFAEGLAQDQAAFGLSLLGGDTTSTPGPISLSLMALGQAARGQAVRRAGAQPGDGIWVTGTIGDGALGLRVAQGQLQDPSGYLLNRYRLPQPRLGLRIAGIASACMDISDGLIQDLDHLCRASGLGAEIACQLVPLSDAARRAGPEWLPTCLTGGDDYELLLAVSPEREAALGRESARAAIPLTRIGRFQAGTPEVAVIGVDHSVLARGSGGWSHF
ncbi:MAG: thiamine-phosphate kinase [Acetobacteraceae bacterium]|nr:thiamine-phosphate kinase [Acetobacteraceae bacterium]